MMLASAACAMWLALQAQPQQLSQAQAQQVEQSQPPQAEQSQPAPPSQKDGSTDAAAEPPQDNDADSPRDQKAEQKEPPTPPHTGVRALAIGVVGDFKHLPSMPNLYLAALGGGLALGAHPVDDDVNVKLRGHQQAARVVFSPGKYIGYTPVQVGAALTVFTLGRIRVQPKVSHLGMDLLRAQLMASVLTTGLKYGTQRERPDFSNSHSFPSGHAAITFATATVLERHLGWRMSALGFTAASYVAASRLHDNRHYLSDVVFGAAVGAISGRTVTQHGRNVWTFAPAPVPGGVALVAMRTGAN